MAELSIDTKALRSFAKALRVAEPALAKGLRLAYRAAGDEVASDARRRADYSTRIPGSIRVRTTQTAAVSVIAGGPQALDAAPLEHQGLPGSFRHPVFGNRAVWVDQTARPFLHPALEAKGEEAKAAVAAALLDTFRLIQVETEA